MVIGKVIFKIRNLIAQKISIDTHDYRGSIFLAGTGRSGTTWVSSIVNYDNSYRDMFEPFRSNMVEMVSHFNYRQYIRPTNNEERFLGPARAILEGRIRNPWVDHLNLKMYATKRVIKDVRANLLIKWLKTHFPEIPMVLILRHPCAVANSKIKLEWETHLDAFLAQDDLMQDFLEPFRGALESAETVYDKHVLLWCVENYVPLRQFKPGEMHIVFYENFCLEPEDEIKRLFSFLNLPYGSKILEKAGKASATSRKESPIHAGRNLIESWRKHVTPDQVKKTVDTLRLFGLDKIYSEESAPVVKDRDSLLLG